MDGRDGIRRGRARQGLGHVAPERILAPLTDAQWGYRRKGRFSVRRVEKKDKTLVGFRETDPRFVADIRECHTVMPQIASKLPELAALIDGMQARREIPQIEFIAGDAQDDFSGVALTIRHLVPLSDSDRDALVAFGQQHGFAIFLQPGGVDSVHALWPQSPKLASPFADVVPIRVAEILGGVEGAPAIVTLPPIAGDHPHLAKLTADLRRRLAEEGAREKPARLEVVLVTVPRELEIERIRLQRAFTEGDVETSRAAGSALHENLRLAGSLRPD